MKEETKQEIEMKTQKIGQTLFVEDFFAAHFANPEEYHEFV